MGWNAGEQSMTSGSPHQEQPVRAAGAILQNATAAMIMIHGRGGSAAEILALSNHFEQPDFAFLAPQAANFTWYPQRFIAPIEVNEPYLTSALQAVDDLVKHVQQAGVSLDHLILLGFSQGACLALEYAARNARRYGGVVAFSGGLMGQQLDRGRYTADLHSTPAFLGCSDVDPHIPLERLKETTAMMRELGADVTEHIYPGMGHTINEDEVDFVRTLVQSLTQYTGRQ
jgi:predicted esterase